MCGPGMCGPDSCQKDVVSARGSAREGDQRSIERGGGFVGSVWDGIRMLYSVSRVSANRPRSAAATRINTKIAMSAMAESLR
jgi:hypothetical protein